MNKEISIEVKKPSQAKTNRLGVTIWFRFVEDAIDYKGEQEYFKRGYKLLNGIKSGTPWSGYPYGREYIIK